MVERLRAQLRHAILGNLLAYVAILLLVGGGLYLIDQRDTQRQRDCRPSARLPVAHRMLSYADHFRMA